MLPGRAVRSIQGAKWDKKSQIRCVQVNLFHEEDVLVQLTPHSLRFPSCTSSPRQSRLGPGELFDQN